LALADKHWDTNVADGSWSTASNWLEGSVPTPSDNVFISFNDGSHHSITYDGAFSSDLSLSLENLGSGTTGLLLPSSNNLQVGTAHFGGAGRAVVTQFAGDVTVNKAMHLAGAASGQAVYNLHGGNLTASESGHIGEAGVGTFIHTGGKHVGAQWGEIDLGSASGSRGTYHLSDTGEFYPFWLSIGRSGAATFTQTGNTKVSAWGIQIATQGGGSGQYELSGTGSVSAYTEFVGMQGTGTFIHSSGTNSVGGGGLRIGAGPGASGAYVLSGTAILDADEVSIGAGGSFHHTGGGNSARRLMLSAGTYTLDGGTLTVEQATSVDQAGRINYNGGAFSAGSLELVGGSDVILSPGPDKTLRTTAISIDSANNSRVDLADGRAIVDYDADSPLATVQSYIISGYHAGVWDGSGIATCAGDAAHGLGYAEATAVFTSFPSTFGGYGVDDTAVLISYARYGDANLDGIVTLADFNRLASGFGQPGRGWTEGDFNYDGIVNLQDFNRLAANFGLTAAGPDVTPADWAALASAVPEPGVGAVLLTGLAWLGRRSSGRRRHKS
jgi:hypothetical protein